MCFFIDRRKKVRLKPLPPFADPNQRETLFLTLGEVHHPRRPEPNHQPQWYERAGNVGLFAGIAIFGAIGTGKTSGCMYPYAEQLIAYRCSEAEHGLGGWFLRSKEIFVRRCGRFSSPTAALRTMWRSI
jgi:hypothetical protein